MMGASSLIGHYMYDWLKKSGHTCLGTRLPGEQRKDAETLAELDLLLPDQMEKLLLEYQPDYIFDFASQNSVRDSWDDPVRTVDVNVNGLIYLFEAVRQLDKQPVIVVFGAGEEYGRVDFSHLPIKESEALCPNNVYAVSKVCQTMMARIYHKAYGLKVVTARGFNVIGPGQSEKFVISDFCKQAVKIEKGDQGPIIYTGNLNIERDFTDVRDVVEACFFLATRGTPGRIYNVASGHAYAIGQVVDILENRLGRKLERKLEADRMRPTDIPKLEADITEIQRDTGWLPKISLAQSINDMFNFWHDRLQNKAH